MGDRTPHRGSEIQQPEVCRPCAGITHVAAKLAKLFFCQLVSYAHAIGACLGAAHSSFRELSENNREQLSCGNY